MADCPVRVARFRHRVWRSSGDSAEPSTNPPAGEGLPADAPQRVREPAVAGLFYPGDEKTLRRTVDCLLADAPNHPIQRLRGLICPHAGYAYSGQTAAIG